MFMNNAQVREAALALATQFEKLPGNAAAISSGYQTIIGRKPTATELNSISAFIDTQENSYKTANQNNVRKLALADMAQVLFGLNEFIYVQ